MEHGRPRLAELGGLRAGHARGSATARPGGRRRPYGRRGRLSPPRGGELPGEATLRGCFRDTLALPDSAPLRLGPEGGSGGFHDSRVYRVLFAGDLRLPCLARLAPEVITLAEDADDPRTRIAGTGGLRTARDVFTWEPRRIGPGVACCVDLTAHLGTPSDGALRPLLRSLTTAIRHAGPIPVTIERFS